MRKTQEKNSYKRRIMLSVFSIISILSVTAVFLVTKQVRAEEPEPHELLEEYLEEQNGESYDYEEDGWEFGQPAGPTGDWAWYRKLDDEDYNEILTVSEGQHKYLSQLDSIFSTVGPTEENDNTPSLMWSLMEASNSPVKAGREIIMAFGVVFVIFYGITEMLKMLKNEDGAPVELILRVLILTVVGVMFVIYIYDILTLIENLGHELVSGIRDSVAGYEYTTVTYQKIDIPEATLEAASEVTWFDEVKFWFKSTFDSIGNWFKDIVDGIKSSIYSGIIKLFANIGLTFTFYTIIASAYGLLFEMVLRKMFMPIAVADLMADGMRSPAVRYLKSYFAVYIRIGMFYVLVQLCLFMEKWAEQLANYDIAKSINTVLGPIGVCICARMATKALLNATGGLAKEVIGD